jgi:hypothetical protein
VRLSLGGKIRLCIAAEETGYSFTRMPA